MPIISATKEAELGGSWDKRGQKEETLFEK
jgi:hypothetical protein